MLYLIALLPILLYVLCIKAMDGFSIASWKRLLGWFVWGILVCLALFGFARLTSWEFGFWAPFLEELLKASLLVIMIMRKRVAFFAEALIYGTAAGAGFAFLENITYVSVISNFSLGDAILRGFGTAILHMGCTALYASVAVTMARVLAAKHGLWKAGACLLSLVPSFCIHFVYNLFLIPEYFQLILVIAVMMGLFVVIYDIDGRLIHKWLDSCISNDISLLASMKTGHLRDTAAGEYLMDVRKKIDTEVFFDICAYLGLYLELSISAKSRMILKEADIKIPVDRKVHQENIEKMKELKSLRKNIGLSGLMVLKPIINEKAVDSWVLDELL